MIQLGKDEIMLMNAFSNILGVNAKDCLIGNSMVSFVVKENEMGNAIGKNGIKVQKLRKMLNKNVELLPYSDDPKKFFSLAFAGINFSEISMQENDGKKILFAKTDLENRRKLLQNSGKMKRVKEIAKRNYEIGDIKIK